jgi:mono/diheme cytochrome c family protein
MPRPVAITLSMVGCLLAYAACTQLANAAASASVEHGRYLVRIAGCNDCHTDGYNETGGKIPEKQWLMGSKLGWHGPWGTTYAPNLRLFMQTVTEAQWLALAKSTTYRPPMPWVALHHMSKLDLSAIYHFIRYLGPAGVSAPAFVPPDQQPKGPVVQFTAPPPATNKSR